MTDYVIDLFRRYSRQGILIDTNILLLWLVGSTNRSRIALFSRTSRFAPEDYDLLVRIFASFTKVVTMPNILTEVSNFINQLGEPERSRCFTILARDVTQLEETYVSSAAIAKMDKFPNFGLTDGGIANLAKNSYLVLTDDLKLGSYLQSIGIDTLNFNVIRFSEWND